MQRLPRFGLCGGQATLLEQKSLERIFPWPRLVSEVHLAQVSSVTPEKLLKESFWRSGEVGDPPSSDSEPRTKKLLCIATSSPLSSLDFEGLMCEVLQGLMMQIFPNTGFCLFVLVF